MNAYLDSGTNGVRIHAEPDPGHWFSIFSSNLFFMCGLFGHYLFFGASAAAADASDAATAAARLLLLLL